MNRFRFTLGVVLSFLILASGGAVQAGQGNKSAYPFVVAPDKAFPILDGLKKHSAGKVAISADEVQFFAKVASGQLPNDSFAEAALLASGVVDSAKRKEYMAHLEKLTAEARKALASAQTSRDKGEALLKFLHKGPMAKGYHYAQTNLAELLDTGKFNCVSSAVLYNIIGRRLGLNLYGVVVPNHAFSVLKVDGLVIDVETTNPLGFDPAKDEAAKKATIKKNGGRYLMAKTYSDRREVGELALAGMIYYNRGVKLMKDKQFHQAALVNFAALNLDRDDASAVTNAQASLIKWGLDLSRTGKYEEALGVVAVGLQLAPKCSALVNNHKVFWSRYAESTLKSGAVAKVHDILKRAELALHHDKDAYLRIVRRVYDTWANAKIEKQDWEGAIKIYADGLKKYNMDSHLLNNAVVAVDSWAQTHMGKKEWLAAAKVYEKGLQHFPNHSHLSHNLKFCQEQLKG